jgi:hypothetical protein
MATIPAQRITVINLVSSSGAVRIQTFSGSPTHTQSLVQDFELTAAQNAALQTALAAAATTITNFDFPSAESVLTGIYNAS